MTEGRGVPVGLSVAGANRNAFTLTEATLRAIVVARPEPTAEQPQHLALDKGYDDEVRRTGAADGDTAHIRARGEEATARRELPGYRARRWMVERAHSWLNRFRRLLIRWEKKTENDTALLHFACAWIAFRAAKVAG